eukprot:ANDGO_02006.mRNA.1 hypothetical protein
MPILGISTCHKYPNYHYDDKKLVEAFQAVEPSIELQAFDWRLWNQEKWYERVSAVLIRSMWDYHEHLEEFVSWLADVQNRGILLINPVEVVLWNTNKEYLFQVQSWGIPIMPSFRVHEHVPYPLVIKPFVSAGSRDTQIVNSDEELHAFYSLHSIDPNTDTRFFKQPFSENVKGEGEWSCLFFGKKYSHTIRKIPKEGEWRVQEEFGGSIKGGRCIGARMGFCRASLPVF